MKKTAFLFPGQGSQFVGMGLDLYQNYDSVKQSFDMAEDITGINLSELCFTGPVKDLTKTINLQPAITLVNLACVFVLASKGFYPDISAGHSLGEYSALYTAGVISQEDTIKLVYKRGELMHREAVKNKGAMSAIIGLNIDTVKDIVNQAQEFGIVSVANHNAEKQIVITGEPEPVKKAGLMAGKQKGKAIPLKVSGAWHSQLIKGAEQEFKAFMDTISFNSPKSGVIHNVCADFVKEPENIKAAMVKQLCSPVRWYDSVNRLIDEKVEIFVEVGPGKVLSGLLRKIVPKDYPCKIFNVSDMKTLENFLGQTG